MTRRWLLTLFLGFALLVWQIAPALAGFEAGDPGIGNHSGHSNPNNNHVDPDHGPKP